MRSRVLGVVTLLLLCPITAELLQAYLSDLGGPFGTAFAVLFFAPLYGGAALLVREVSERTGRGWTGRLLLAAAFGVAMPTIIDVSLFTPVHDDIDGWERIFTAAQLGGIGWSAVLTWVGGHVDMSVGVPLVVAEALARRPGPWLGRLGTALVVLGFLSVAVFVHRDQVGQFDVRTSPTTYAVSGAIVLALVGAALSPLGRPLPTRAGRVPAPGWCLLAGAVAMAIWDLTPPSWVGVAITVTLFVVVGVVVSRWARSPEWTVRHLVALAYGAVLVRSLLGFTVWIVLVVVLGWALERRTRPTPVMSSGIGGTSRHQTPEVRVYEDSRPCAVCGAAVRLEPRDVREPDLDRPVGPADGVVGTGDPTVDTRVCTNAECPSRTDRSLEV